MQDFLAFPAAYYHEVDFFPGHRELHPGNSLRAHFVRHLAAGIYQYPIAVVAHIEGDVFIGNFRGGAAVLVPHVHHLPVFHKGREPFPQAVNAFAHAQVELHPHERPFRGFHSAYHGVAEAVANFGEKPPVIREGKGGRV